MPDWPTFIIESDLAPGDRRPHPKLPNNIELIEITSEDDPHFSAAYELLAEEFLAAGEMESRSDLAKRFRLRPDQPINGFGMKYTLLLLRVEGEWAGVRDHTAIISEDEVTVHLSHALIVPKWRRQGLSALLRTLPITQARQAAASVGIPNASVTLFCEMEPFAPQEAAHLIRRRSYEKAGFTAIAPDHGYIQPDFRAPSEIEQDPNGPRPLPLDLLFHRVDHVQESTVSGLEIIRHIERVFSMYQTTLHPDAMAPCLEWLQDFRKRCPDSFQLHPPTKIL
jgi:GNAT superfamily N-acetyltransferase